MDSKSLRVFLEVVKAGSFSKAAETLLYSRQSISKVIGKLEKELGGTLFERKGKFIVQTDYCKKVYEQFKYLEFTLDELMSNYSDGVGLDSHLKVFTCYLESITDKLVQTASKYKDSKTHFTSVSMDSNEVLNLLLDEECDIAFFTYEKGQRECIEKILDENNLTYTNLITCNPAICVSKNHPLAGKEYVVSKDLNGYGRIETNIGESTIISFTEYMEKNKINKNADIVISSIPDVLNFIAKSEFYCFALNIPLEQEYWNDLVLIPLEETGSEMELVWACKKDFILTEEASYFISLVEEYYRRAGSEVRVLKKFGLSI